MKSLIMKHSNLLSQTKKPATPPDLLQVTYSRATNLRNILVSSSHPVTTAPKGCKPCNKPCATCPLIHHTNSIRSSRTGEDFKINLPFTCQDHNVVYVITCTKCNIQYVGETKRTLNERMRDHCSSIRTNKEHPVATHFSTNNHTMDHFLVTAIDRSHDKNARLRLEEAWMMILDTMVPNGLNGRM